MTARSALRRYMLVGFLTWLPPGLQMTVMVLLMSERGLGLAEIGLVTMVFSAVTVSLELPTGGLSDVVGRRVVLAVSAAFTVVALVLMSVSTTFWMFLASGVLKGVARALSSGPATSWYVDTLHAVEGREADIKPGLAKGAMMESAALCAGVLGGGCLPLLVPPSLMFPLAAPPLAGAVAAGRCSSWRCSRCPSRPARADRSAACCGRCPPRSRAASGWRRERRCCAA